MAGLLMFCVLAGVALRLVYALARPLFWVALVLLVFVGLPLVLVLAFSRHLVGL